MARDTQAEIDPDVEKLANDIRDLSQRISQPFDVNSEQLAIFSRAYSRLRERAVAATRPLPHDAG